jgi:3-dehydroquinate dehydratase-2
MYAENTGLGFTDSGGNMKILVINGPNINLLGLREPEIYGRQDYAALVAFIRDACAQAGVEAEFVQSNHEGAIVDAIQAAYGRFDGIVINPAAYTHTSVAILDALKAVGIPAVEVHISDISKREEFRKKSYAGMACEKTVAGMGFEGYAEAVRYLSKKYGGGKSLPS